GPSGPEPGSRDADQAGRAEPNAAMWCLPSRLCPGRHPGLVPQAGHVDDGRRMHRVPRPELRRRGSQRRRRRRGATRTPPAQRPGTAVHPRAGAAGVGSAARDGRREAGLGGGRRGHARVSGRVRRGLQAGVRRRL
ncbi:MAG: hypothetical protein AVDCRST_MAG49-926, partial [uncultured Thermomicrobiales bacterium]